MARENMEPEKSQPAPQNVAPSAQVHGSLFRWLDLRTGLRSLLHTALDEPIPGGARLAYVFGSGLLFLFISQVITGVFLALYYVPSADHAHTTVAYITKEVTGGAFLRSIHAYGSSAVIIVLLLHITQTFLYGSYKGRRELLWVAGCVLFVLMLGMAFTGYLLPWDQKAYFATTVGTNVLSEVPLIGGALKRLLRGGTEMGTLTLSRFFVLHVFLIPACIFAFVALHIFLFRRAGAAGPASEPRAASKRPAEMFYPRQVLFDLAFALLIIASLGILAHFAPMDLGPRANPADTQFIPRPEWYYLPVFQWLKYWHGPLAVLGILVIPGIVALVFLLLPFFDRSPERRPWKRPLAVTIYAAIFIALGILGGLSHRSDLRDPEVASQVARQNQDVKAFMKEPFEPELAGSSVGVVNAALASTNPLAAKGKDIFEQQGCNACHGDGGVGSAAGPKLIGVSAKFNPEQLEKLLKLPSAAMKQGGMQPVDLKDEDLKSLIAYISSLK
ncbi:MAG TPA: cytochrome b N-terminal domain-containing protein [Candidatus Acidoferrales bacterium]|jgi:ubiquinol-cytochrome c reductase cytochrome b subunit|nr:cytochrome b N-terminal domain-containing protein [Candidatus Acidoferrales bacterium]